MGLSIVAVYKQQVAGGEEQLRVDPGSEKLREETLVEDGLSFKLRVLLYPGCQALGSPFHSEP